MVNFPCTKCTLCCTNLDVLLANKQYLDPVRKSLFDLFPYKPKEDGSCEMLSEDGSCTVYEDRPDICNISTVAKALNTDITEYYRISARSCNQLIINAGLPAEYLVNLEQIREKTD